MKNVSRQANCQLQLICHDSLFDTMFDTMLDKMLAKHYREIQQFFYSFLAPNWSKSTFCRASVVLHMVLRKSWKGESWGELRTKL